MVSCNNALVSFPLLPLLASTCPCTLSYCNLSFRFPITQHKNTLELITSIPSNTTTIYTISSLSFSHVKKKTCKKIFFFKNTYSYFFVPDRLHYRDHMLYTRQKAQCPKVPRILPKRPKCFLLKSRVTSIFELHE